MNVKINFDVFKGILFTFLAVFLILITPSQIKVSADMGSGARSFPHLAIGIMMVSGIGMILKGVVRGDKQYFVICRDTLNAWRVPLMVLVFIGIYMFMIPRAGFLISSIIAVNVCLLFLKSKVFAHYIACDVVVIAIFFIFTHYLNVLLPALSR